MDLFSEVLAELLGFSHGIKGKWAKEGILEPQMHLPLTPN